jgi:hypothetical protein
VCLFGPASSSLARCAPAFGGFGLDLAGPNKLLLAIGSTERTSIFGCAENGKERACMMDRD